jgi:NADH-quinone oxidoreductase subunit C
MPSKPKNNYLLKEFPMEDSGRTDKDDRFFGRTMVNA